MSQGGGGGDGIKNIINGMGGKVRERDGLPWGFPEQPAPIPVKTRTRSLWVL